MERRESVVGGLRQNWGDREKERCSEGGGGSWREGGQETEEERVWRGEDENEGVRKRWSL